MAEETKLLGMKAESGRWILVLTGMFINLCLGTVYAWSVFKKPIEGFFNASATQGMMPFIVFLAFFALVMPFAGRLIDRLGPKAVALLGGVVVGLGWILSKFAPSVTMLTVTYGIIAGSGVGMVYGVPIAVSGRWFPDKKGLAVGLTVLGFGLSALITAPLARALIASPTVGIMNTFAILGIAFLILVVLLSFTMQFPPAGWKPQGWAPTAAAAAAAVTDLEPMQMVKTSSFYGLWICFIIGTVAGLMAIGISSPVGQEIIKLDAAKAATLVSLFAIFNGGGRPVFGWLTDKLSPRNTAILSFIIILLVSLGMLTAKQGQVGLYAVCFCGFWMCLGGWLAIAPTSTLTFFGVKNLAKNYGLVFSSYGIGAIIGGLTSGRIKDIFGSYQFAFIPTAALAVVGIFIALTLLKPPAKK